MPEILQEENLKLIDDVTTETTEPSLMKVTAFKLYWA